MFEWVKSLIKKFKKEKSLIIRLNKELKKLKASVNNQKKFILESREVLLIIQKLEKTDIYWFIKEDINKIKSYIKKARENPKNKGIVYFLTGIYIVSPGTFELTGIILFFRYSFRLLSKRKLNKG